MVWQCHRFCQCFKLYTLLTYFSHPTVHKIIRNYYQLINGSNCFLDISLVLLLLFKNVFRMPTLYFKLYAIVIYLLITKKFSIFSSWVFSSFGVGLFSLYLWFYECHSKTRFGYLHGSLEMIGINSHQTQVSLFIVLVFNS